MHNVLYLGPYKENNGFGRGSRRVLDGLLSSTDFNVSSRPIYLTGNVLFNDDEYSKLEYSSELNSSDKYDYVIQHGHPMMFQYRKEFGINIGITDIETKNLSHTGFVDRINLLDMIVVHSHFAADSLEESGVKIPIRVIPQPYNIDTDSVESNFFSAYDTKPYIFYTIGQYEEKNNILGMVLAFLLEFDDSENVRLFIKTGDYQIDNNVLQNKIIEDISRLIKITRKGSFSQNKIDILCGTLRDDDINRLHKSSHCYCNCVRADSFGPSAVEASLFGNVVINTQNIGSSTYINEANGLMVNSQLASVFSSHYYYKNSFTIYEQWYEPVVSDIRKNMRLAYSQSKTINNSFIKDITNYKYFTTNII